MTKIKFTTLEIEKLAEETILVVSDVHLGYQDKSGTPNFCNKEDFNSFLSDIKNKEITCNRLIITGDFLDMWRRDIAGVILENADTIYLLEEIKKANISVNFVVGNHDYYMRNFKVNNYGYEFTYDEGLQLIDPDNKFEYLFLHGYEFDPIQQRIFFDPLCFSSDELGQLSNDAHEWFMKKYSLFKRMWKWIKGVGRDLKKKLKKLEKTAENRFDINPLNLVKTQSARQAGDLPTPDKFPRTEREAIKYAKEQDNLRVFVFGHTHRPFIYLIDNVSIGNSGTWVNQSTINCTFIRIHKNEQELCSYTSPGQSTKILGTITQSNGTRALV
ncbi:MAG: UDP-2,3-diacylglucosamine diphosphatase [Candidatus Kariarchaeaceae archaeon]|jgi:UDP-2,3-diacylglucosamine pyrophosphatase LpxH